MTLSRFLALFVAVVGTAAFIQAQQPNSEPTRNTQPTFKQHRIGESAQEFFSIAKMADKNGMLSTDYCRSYLNDPKVKKAIEKAKKKSGDDTSSLVATMNVEGCNNIRAALAGQDIEVEVRFAAEFGSGSKFSEFVRCLIIAGSDTDTSVPMLSPSNDCNSETFTRKFGSVHIALRCLTIAPTAF